MKNQEVAKCFAELAGLLEFKGENSFRVSSYRRAARIIEEVTADVAELARDGKLQELPGVGEGIAKKIVEYLETGKIKRLEEARQGVPRGRASRPASSTCSTSPNSSAPPPPPARHSRSTATPNGST